MDRGTVNRDVFTATIKFADGIIQNDDKVFYRIITNDNSISKNQTISPATDFYAVDVKGLKDPQATYKADFSEATIEDDFVGSSMLITTPSSFDNPAIHSEHPYKDGSGENDESNYTMQLRIPITVSSENALMRFNEIVLVEPGEAGSSFGQQEFWDYVILEGSNDEGATWRPIAPGYDATYNTVWEGLYNSSIEGNNSTAVGTPDLYRTHVMDLSRIFSVGENVVIRFRLFADQAAHGWGWTIDDLQIQGDLADFLTNVDEQILDENQEVKIFPNPTEENISLEMPIPWGTSEVKVSIIDQYGMIVKAMTFSTIEKDELQEQISLANLPKGVYYIRVFAKGKQIIRKIILQ